MRFAQEISIFNPFAIEKRFIEMGTTITQTAEAIELRAAQLYAEKGQVTELDSRLTIMAGDISAEVTARQEGDNALSGRITVNAGNITAEANARSNADEALSGRITVNANNIESKVSKGSIISTINQSAESVTINASKVNLSGYVTVTGLGASGTTTVNGNRIHGGTIKLGGAGNGNGQLYVYDASNAEIGHWNKDGIYIKNGEIYQEKYVDSSVKNAWLRIKSTDIEGGYTGLGHTAIVDLQDWQYITDPGTGQQEKEGMLNLRCTNGSIALNPDKSVYIQAKEGLTLYAQDAVKGISIGYMDANTGAFQRGFYIADAGMVIAPGGEDKLYVNYAGMSFQGSTKLNTRFADDASGARRFCHLVNGLICGLTY